MKIKTLFEKKILEFLDLIIPNTTFDRLILERRRRIHKINGFYPEAVFLSKKKSQKKYCVVRYSSPTFGIMAAGIQYVFCYYHLISRGYIPVLDIEYAFSFKQGRIGEHNIWDLCFEQLITAKEVREQPYLLATGRLLNTLNKQSVSKEINGDIHDCFIHIKKENYREYYSKIKKICEPIWKVKHNILSEVDEKMKDVWSKHRVLGVFIKEEFTEDVKKDSEIENEVYNNHPLLPGVKDVIRIIKEQLLSWNFDYIFVSAAFYDSIELFITEFGEKILFFEREKFFLNETLAMSFDMNEEELYESSLKYLERNDNMALSYVKDIVALSKCHYLIGGASSGMATALVMNGGNYEDIFILEDSRSIKRY